MARDDLLLYYERELTWLRQMGAEFAQKYPKVASRLLLESDKCEDPHVERLLEAFAFLSARVHLKIDDEFPEISESLLSVVYPSYIRPIPSMSIVEFQVDVDQGKLTTGMNIERGTLMYSRPVGGVPCKFRTCYDTTIWPADVVAAEWKTPDRLRPPIAASDAVASIRLELKCGPDLVFPAIGMDHLQFYLAGDGAITHKIYELLCSRLRRIVIRDPTPNTRVPPVTLPPTALRPMGFEENESMLPHNRRSFVGYALLQEYFAFPEKYLFFRLSGLKDVWPAGFQQKAEIIFLFGRFEGEERRELLESGITARTFRTACTPVINLFQQPAEPVLMNQKRYEYPVVPDVRRPGAMEIYSIDEVSGVNVQSQEVIEFQPFYSFHRGVSQREKAFWLSARRPSNRPGDLGSDMYISLLDLSMRPIFPDSDTLVIKATCTNRNLPARLPFGNQDGDFDLENNGPIERIVAIAKPTEPLRAPMGKGVHWRLISHLSLNYLSLVGEGREALQEILKLYNFTESMHTAKTIEGIVRVQSQPHFARLVSDHGITFARGTRVEVELDETQFVGAGVYLFASVLERFLGHYVSLNSFSQLRALTRQRKEPLQEWPPRAGRQILL
jgi:type VI secretion system protein ImpG